jgi:RNA polymerase sigma factor (sigma-70 family)
MSASDPDQSSWFAEYVLPHAEPLRAWLQHNFPTLGDAEDIVQASYERLLRVRETGPIANPRAFLFVTARHLALNQLRRVRRERREPWTDLDEVTSFVDASDIPESLAHREELRLLVQAIQNLPGRCRDVMTLRKIYGLSQKEVAMRLGIAEHTVEVQSRIGLRKCSDFFRQHGYQRGGNV